MAASNKTQMVLCYDNIITVSSGQQPPVTSARQPSMKFIHPIITNFRRPFTVCTRRPASADRTARRQFQATGQPV